MPHRATSQYEYYLWHHSWARMRILLALPEACPLNASDCPSSSRKANQMELRGHELIPSGRQAVNGGAQEWIWHCSKRECTRSEFWAQARIGVSNDCAGQNRNNDNNVGELGRETIVPALLFHLVRSIAIVMNAMCLLQLALMASCLCAMRCSAEVQRILPQAERVESRKANAGRRRYRKIYPYIAMHEEVLSQYWSPSDSAPKASSGDTLGFPDESALLEGLYWPSSLSMQCMNRDVRLLLAGEENAHVVEVGGHLGQDTVLYAQLASEVDVFEMGPAKS